MEAYTGWTYAAASVIGEEIAKLKFRLFQISKDGTHEEIFDHDLLNLLSMVNPYQTAWELKFMLGVHMSLVGDAYWLMDGVDNATQTPKGLYPLIPAYMKIKTGEFPNLIQQYEYRVGTKKYTYKPEQVLHFRYPNPLNMLEGFGVVQGIANWIDADNYAMEFNRRFFLNGAKVGGFLESETARSQEMLDYMKKSFEALFKGVDNAYRVVALPKGTSFKEAANTRKDMDFVDGQRLMRDAIIAGFRVPRTALGITDDVNRANAEATDYVFASRTIKPKYELICSFLNAFLVPRYGDGLYLGYDDPVPRNRELELNELKAVTNNQAILSINEAREEYAGLGPIENGDNVLIDFNKTPLGAPKQSPKEYQPKIRNAEVKQPLKKPSPIKETSSKVAEAVVETIKALSEERQQAVKTILDFSHDEYEEKVWQKFVTRLEPYQKKLMETVRSFNARQKSEVLQRVFDLIKAIDPSQLFDEHQWNNELVAVVDPILTDLTLTEGIAAGELIGYSDFRLTRQVREALDHAMELLARSYNQTTLQLLKDTLEQGLEQGDSLPELRDRVEQVYGLSDTTRATQVADTETFRVANEATKSSWQQSGVVKTIKWFTAGDELVCEFCAEQDGKVIGIDENFYDKGDTATGRDDGTLNLDYDDVGAPPLHTSCRCYIRPEDIEP